MTKERYARGKHPNSLKNLHPFKKGEVHNPDGRPPNPLSITTKQREMLPLPCPHSKKGETWLEWLAAESMKLAGENAQYYKELMDRLEGKVMQPIANEGEVTLRVVYEQSD